ncbi:MAG: histidine kinase dimerization/phospho-acceptor domain-containing protein, partial [Betaproteobacteria bacterium]
MRKMPLARLKWPIGWALLVATGVLAIVRLDIAQRRDTFQAEARIAHRLLSQRAAQHDAILATLALLSPAIGDPGKPEQRLPAVYPQLLAVIRSDSGQAWLDLGLQDAERRSRSSRRAELGPVDVRSRQYTLVQASDPISFALRIDVQRMVPWQEWPVRQPGPVRVVLALAGQALVLQSGQSPDSEPFGLTEGFVFAERLAPDSQPFVLQLRQATGPAYWPWTWLLGWVMVSTLGMTGFVAWQRARRSNRRAQQLLQFGQVARLNAMGELAAGMAHELNQPLSAIVANAQATRRILADDAPALDTVRHAIGQIEAQGRRAADVVTRLRRQVEAPQKTGALRPTDLLTSVRRV